MVKVIRAYMGMRCALSIAVKQTLQEVKHVCGCSTPKVILQSRRPTVRKLPNNFNAFKNIGAVDHIVADDLCCSIPQF